MTFCILVLLFVWRRLHWFYYHVLFEDSEDEKNFWSHVNLKGFPPFKATVCVRTCFGGYEVKPFLTKLDIGVTAGRNFDIG